MHALNLRFAGRYFVVLVAFIILLCTVSTPVQAVTAGIKIKNPPVLLYGDSIGVEVTPYMRRSIRRTLHADLISRAFFGYNACDWHDQAKIDSKQYAPRFVIIMFVGNYLTPCMTANGASPSPKKITRVTTRYITQLIANFPNSTIILSGFGRSIDQELIREQTHSVTFTDVLNQSLFQLARRTDNRYVSVARSLYNSEGKAKRFLSCSKETDGNLCPQSSKVAVRSPDGLHLCPVAYTINEAGVTAPCRVAIPGAARVAADIMRVLVLVR
ncbi:MAG: SGNH/GDSL hydrolase family protein [Ilumatobacteraceae bacterium]|nr:SGNH/GDSL hydrolase family protein [Ilumatobacteraceae bacterium]